jgi:DNA-binding CsgD family transcriptional regulator
MAILSQRDQHAILQLLQEIYGMRHLDSFRHHIIKALPALVRCETVSYNEVNVREGRNNWFVEPDSGGFSRYRHVFDRHLHEHPLIRHYAITGDGRALKISDFLSQRQFHRLGLYQEFYRPLGIEHQMAVTLSGRSHLVIGIALNRGRPDFTERERLCLNLLRPHLIQAYRNAQALTHQERELALMARGTDEAGLGAIVLDARLRVRLMTSCARQSLEEFCGQRFARNQRLPEDLERWVRPQQNPVAFPSETQPRKSLVLERGEKRLVVRMITDSNSYVLLFKNRIATEPPDAIRDLGLTGREAEVMAWICRGRTNADIAAILKVSVRTVEKHVERILEKLGAENRTPAAALARQFTGRGDPGTPCRDF